MSRVARPTPRLFALETEYRGIRYRSRLEARWAVCLDMLGIPHIYEPQGYRTSFGTYLPDFWLPSLTRFVEVKPTAFTREQLGKCAEVAHGTGCAFVLLVGAPAARTYDELCADGTIARHARRFGTPGTLARAAQVAADTRWST